MQFLKFLLGVILVQIMTLTLFFLAPDKLDFSTLLRLFVPLIFISLSVAFWFKSIAEYHNKDVLQKLEGNFAKEREKLRVNAERAKRRVEKAAQKNIIKEATHTHAKANFKVGLAVAGVIGVGGLFVLAQMVTAGLLALSAGSGVLGGYYWRGKRLDNKQLKLAQEELKGLKNNSVLNTSSSVLKMLKKN